MDVACAQRVVYAAYYLARLQRSLHLLVHVAVGRVDEEAQAVMLARQVVDEYLFGLGRGVAHVVDEHRAEVACHYPARAQLVRQLGRVSLGLLVGREHGAVALAHGLAQVLVYALLLYEYVRRLYVCVDEAGVAEAHLVFKLYYLLGPRHAQYVAQQREPVSLRLALLVAASPPLVGEGLRGFGRLHAVFHLLELYELRMQMRYGVIVRCI